MSEVPLHFKATQITTQLDSLLVIGNNLCSQFRNPHNDEPLINTGRGTTGAEDVQETTTQSHISASKLVHEDDSKPPGVNFVIPTTFHHESTLFHSNCFAARRNVKRFRGGLVLTAHRLWYHSTLGSTVIKTKKENQDLY